MRSVAETAPLERAVKGLSSSPLPARTSLPLMLSLLLLLLGGCGNDPVIIPSDDDTESPTPETPSPTPEPTPSPTPEPTPTPVPCEDPADVLSLCEAVVQTTVYYPDQDLDGYGDTSRGSLTFKSGYVTVRGDCNDTDRNTHPGADDPVNDGKDQDCGGSAGPEPHVGFSSSSRFSIQLALNAAAYGATVFVAPGTWREHDLNFFSRGIRLMSTHGAAATVIDAEGLGRGFVISTGETAQTVIDGFKIVRGSVCGDEGGGFYIENSSPTIQNCIVCGNSAHALEFTGGDGGGLYLSSSSATLSQNIIAHNLGQQGGGISSWSSSPTVTDSTFSNNRSRTNGGGLAMFESTGTVRHVLFTENRATRLGGGAHIQTSSPAISQCRFLSNEAYEADGGGLFLDQSSASVSDSLFEGNSAGWGGAIWVSNGSPTLSSLGIYDNQATYEQGGGGGIYVSDASPSITSCVLLRNRGKSPESGGGLEVLGSSSAVQLSGSILAYQEGYNLRIDASQGMPAVTVTYSDLYSTGRNHNLSSLGATNLTVEPGLRSMTAGAVDLHLSGSSPLKDVGDPALKDPDGSRADMGIYSGPDGAKWDLDHDNLPAYFWPGSFADTPAGVSSSAWDCADLDVLRAACP